MHQLEKNTEGDLRLYQVYDAINRYADEDALYSVDVGDVTQTSIRHLHMTPKNTWRTSELFATMGNGLPGAIAAKLEFKNRQVWSLSGDGGFAMNMQDIVTAVKYNLPSIHVVFSNQQFGFIRDSQLDTNDAIFGVDLTDVDFAKIAEAQGAVGYTLKTIEEIDNVFSKAIEDLNAGRVVLIDAKIMDERPIPVENLILDKELYSETEINDFKALYNGENLVTLKELLNA
jgi:pyruvate oxidase